MVLCYRKLIQEVRKIYIQIKHFYKDAFGLNRGLENVDIYQVFHITIVVRDVKL